PYDLSITKERSTKRGAIAANFLSPTPSIFWISQHIRNLNHFGRQRSSPGNTALVQRDLQGPKIFPDACVHVGVMTVAGDPAEVFTFAQEQPGMISVAQPRRRLGQRVKYCLQIERRTAYDPQYFTGRRLASMRLIKLTL